MTLVIDNPALEAQVRDFAAAHRLPPAEVMQMAWQKFNRQISVPTLEADEKSKQSAAAALPATNDLTPEQQAKLDRMNIVIQKFHNAAGIVPGKITIDIDAELYDEYGLPK